MYSLPHPIREQLTERKKLHRTNQDSNDFSSKMDPSILLAIRKWSIDKVRRTTKEKGPSNYKLHNSTNVNVKSLNDDDNYDEANNISEKVSKNIFLLIPSKIIIKKKKTKTISNFS